MRRSGFRLFGTSVNKPTHGLGAVTAGVGLHGVSKQQEMSIRGCFGINLNRDSVSRSSSHVLYCSRGKSRPRLLV